MEWKERIVEAINERFPKKMSPEDKVISLVCQVASVGEEIQFSKGTRKFISKPEHENEIGQTIVSVMLDIFVLCDMYDVDIDKELEKCEQWFKNEQ